MEDFITQKKKIATKWEKFIDDPDLAILCENQQKSIDHNLTLYHYSSSIIRKVWQNLIIRKLMSVQPVLWSDPFLCCPDGEDWQCRKIETTDYKLRAIWLEGYDNSLDSASEYIIIMSQEIVLELNRKFINAMRMQAGTKERWNWEDSLGSTIDEKYESLYCKLTEMLPRANWIVTSPEIASIFEPSCSYVPQDVFIGSLGTQYIGKINNRWNLYKDPLFPTYQILLGYKGEDHDAGYFWCPKVMLKLGDKVGSNLVDRRSLSVESGHYVHNTNYYGVLTIDDFTI